MAADVIMPMLGLAQDTGKVVRWLKSDGDVVAKGEPLLEIETDKVTVEIESPAAGTLNGVCAVEGAEVAVGSVIAVVLGDGEEPSIAERSASPDRAAASPKARRLARELGVDLTALTGSGPGGAVVAGDIVSPNESPSAPDRGVPVGAVWRVMASRTLQSWREVPQFVLWRDVDVSALEGLLAAARSRPGGQEVTVTDLLVRASADALARHPNVNSSWNDETIVTAEHVNVAIAVATNDGLIAPVIHDADKLDLEAVSAQRRELVAAARAGRLRPADLQDGTFTVSNLGMYAVDGFQAIVNAPQAAILAVGRIGKRPVVANDEVVVRAMAMFSVSFDHRVVDGARGAEFLETLVSLVEGPGGSA
jgi:pyruvate dehydrogenase E2 component (dihydrolipoamide acetyltransferase)